MLITKMNLVAATIAGTIAFAALADDLPLNDAASAENANTACYVAAEDDEDAIILTAWAEAGASGSYRMVATQRTSGGGGFDIVQEGDFDSPNDYPVLLSDMILDVDADFSIRLKTWNPSGELNCDWVERI